MLSKKGHLSAPFFMFKAISCRGARELGASLSFPRSSVGIMRMGTQQDYRMGDLREEGAENRLVALTYLPPGVGGLGICC